MASANDVAKILQISVSSVYRGSEDGEIPGRKIDGRWVYNLEEIEEWIENMLWCEKHDYDNAAELNNGMNDA